MSFVIDLQFQKETRINYPLFKITPDLFIIVASKSYLLYTISMSTYVKPWADIYIRYLFGRESNKDLLLSFINAVLEDDGFTPIVSIELKNPFNLREAARDKESILDIKACDESGRMYDIEVQSGGSSRFKQRSLYYWAKNYTAQLETGEQYTALNPVICINILDFVLIQDLDNFHTCFLPMEKDNPEYVLTDHFMLHFLELPKLVKHDDFTNSLERWIAYLKYEGMEDTTMKLVIKDDPVFEKAHEEYSRFTEDDAMREMYEAREKWRKDYNTGMAEARHEGHIEDARRMLRDGMSKELIAKYTGLSLEEIEKL